MSEHTANIVWTRGGHEFAYTKYSRDHVWRFDGGVVVDGSASPDYRGNPSCVDPEEALVASLSSCHMLTFLAFAAEADLVVESYEDNAVGYLDKSGGVHSITKIVLHPKIVFEGSNPTADELQDLHHKAHAHCFIANSIKAEVTVESV